MSAIQLVVRQIEKAYERIEIAFEKFLPEDRSVWENEEVLKAATVEYINSLPVVGEYKGLKVVNYHDHLLAVMSIFPGVSGAAVIAPSDEVIIIINDEFSALPENLKEALLEHEYAHYVNSDLETIMERGQDEYMRDCLRGEGVGFDIELRADAASLEAGFPIKEALIHLRDQMVAVDLPDVTKLGVDSLNLRIEAL